MIEGKLRPCKSNGTLYHKATFTFSCSQLCKRSLCENTGIKKITFLIKCNKNRLRQSEGFLAGAFLQDGHKKTEVV